MAEAYASLVSLMHIIDQIMDHGRDSFSLNHQQIESLQERAAYLVAFLERYSHGDNKDVEGLESQIADASHAAEDLIESRVVDYIHDNQSTSTFAGTSSNTFCQQLQEVIEVMDSMKDKAMEIKGKGELKVHLPRDSIPSSSSSSLPAGKDTMVGFDDVLIQIMDKLTRQQSNFQIIPIYGMGGIGKTTLARNVYKNPYIVRHFDNRAWVTISQEYEIKKILSSLLIEFKVLSKETVQGMNESQLGEQLHKYLFNRKYLIVMDDMWSIDVWDKVHLFFPDNGNGSGIVITSRLKFMARHLGSPGLEMNFLDEYQSWNLLRQKVFGQQECNIELEEIGKKISKNCKGLPLSIVVIAGILAKSNMTLEEWVHVAKEVNSIASLANDGQCSKILSLSYKNLPVHLKPCFLYMGVFPEDDVIYVSRLIKLWVAEGFLKPNKDKILEEVAEEYFIDLIERNLVMAHEHVYSGEIETFKIHDLLRDMCLREAEKEKFICVTGEQGSDSSEALHNHRRIVIDGREKQQKDSALFRNEGEVSNISNIVVTKEKKSKKILRSITFNNVLGFRYSSLLGCRLIRVLNGDQPDLFEIAFNLVNLRYLDIMHMNMGNRRLPSTLKLLWNLQTLIIGGPSMKTTTPPEIWEMKQLRHLDMYPIYLPIYLPVGLKHLNTLMGIHNLTSCDVGVVKRIPNIKKLKIRYLDFFGDLDGGKDYCLDNLQYLDKLESLSISLHNLCSHLKETHLLEYLTFPQSLKKLDLSGSYIPWEHMSIIGSLPNLEMLILSNNAFVGEEWNPIEGQFLSLKYLLIEMCDKLKVWKADSIHFPNLEQLLLSHMDSLKEIPLGIGEISTLQSIKLKLCCDSVVRSVIDILDEQEDNGNDDIQVEVKVDRRNKLGILKARDNLKFTRQFYYY